MGAPAWTKKEITSLEKVVNQLGPDGGPRQFMGALRKLGFLRPFSSAFWRLKAPGSPQHALWSKLTPKQRESFGSNAYRTYAKAAKVAVKRSRLTARPRKMVAPPVKDVERIERVLGAVTRLVEACR